jgi:hypothetical protein
VNLPKRFTNKIKAELEEIRYNPESANGRPPGSGPGDVGSNPTSGTKCLDM